MADQPLPNQEHRRRNIRRLTELINMGPGAVVINYSWQQEDSRHELIMTKEDIRRAIKTVKNLQEQII